MKTKSIITVFYKDGRVEQKRNHTVDAEGVSNDLKILGLWNQDQRVSAVVMAVEDRNLLPANARWMASDVEGIWRILLGNPNRVDGKPSTLELGKTSFEKPKFSKESSPALVIRGDNKEVTS